MKTLTTCNYWQSIIGVGKGDIVGILVAWYPLGVENVQQIELAIQHIFKSQFPNYVWIQFTQRTEATRTMIEMQQKNGFGEMGNYKYTWVPIGRVCRIMTNTADIELELLC